MTDDKLEEYDIEANGGPGKRIKVEDIAKIAQKAEDEWLKDMRDPEEIKDLIVGILNGKLEKLVAGTLGFDNSWGRWEVQTTNGREPAIVKAVKDEANAAAKEIVSVALKNYKPKSDIVKLVRKEYDFFMKESIKTIARQMAIEKAKELVSETLNRPITNLQKALQELEEEG